MTALAFFHFSRLFFCFVLLSLAIDWCSLSPAFFFSPSHVLLSRSNNCAVLCSFHVLLSVPTLFAISVLCSIPRFGRYLTIVYNIITGRMCIMYRNEYRNLNDDDPGTISKSAG